MSQVYDLAAQLSIQFKSDPSLLAQITTKLLQLTINAGSHCNNNLQKSYCYKFTVPKNQVEQLFNTLDLDKTVVGKMFTRDWGHPSNAHMYSNPYYQILFLLHLVGIIDNNKTLKEKTLILAMVQLWNGRVNTFFPKCCVPEIMNYVVNYMCTNRHLIKKYDNPYDLIENYFVPTLIKKYETSIKRNPLILKTLLSQSFTRIYQIFVQGNKENMSTQKMEATGGIIAYYKKALKDESYLQTKKVNSFGDDSPTFDEFGSTNARETMATDISTYITMNGNPKYPSKFVHDLNKKYKVRLQTIENILKSLHNNLFYDDLYSIYIIFFSRCNINDPSQICKSNIDGLIRKNITSSKNNKDINTMNKIIHNILCKIMNTANFKFENITNTSRINARNVVIWGLVYNMKKQVCNM